MLLSISANDIFPNSNLLSLWSISKLGHTPSMPLITKSYELVSFEFPFAHYKSSSSVIFYAENLYKRPLHLLHLKSP